jgi:hypothetical protein
MQKYLCIPALLYIIFASVQIIFDLVNEMWTLAITKTFVAIIFTFVLNKLCENGLSVISWILVCIPFILTLLLFEILIFILSVKNEINEPIKSFHFENDHSGAFSSAKSSKKETNYNNTQRQFIDISYSESPHVDELVQVDDFNQIE